MPTIKVNYPGGEYSIYIDHDVFVNQPLSKHVSGKQVMVVTNETIAPLYLQKILGFLTNFQVDFFILPDGENHKTLTQMSALLDHIISKGHHRDTTLIALGGGVVGDLVGFTAACFQRGVDFIQIPTTLLAQVDASIGGKTAVNHPQGKNLIGAFHQPQAVYINLNWLSTLPDREYNSGVAEIIKAALIQDADFFNYLEINIGALLQKDPVILLQTVEKACKIKRDIVAIDEKERSIRALLNLGHTFGHAIEQNLDYKGWLHGEAVAVGICLAAQLSYELQYLCLTDIQRIRNLLSKANLPTHLPLGLTVDNLISAMHTDKKIKNNRLTFILLNEIGKGIILDNIEETRIRKLLQNEIIKS